MDKSWIFEPNRFSNKYKSGIQSFMNFVRENLGTEGVIRCPCRKCVNCNKYSQNVVEYHLVKDGMCTSYSKWVYHGEPSDYTMPGTSQNNNFSSANNSDSDENYGDGLFSMLDELQHGIGMDDTSPDDGNGIDEIATLLEKLKEGLYPECSSFSTLEFMVKLLHIKVYNRWSNKSFDMLLELLKKAFPEGNKISKNFYEAMRMLKDVGLGYVPIHACKHDCCLFWKEYKDLQTCPVCGTSRWKFHDKKIPWKVLRYFPIKPRLQRLFLSRETAEAMRWHHEKREDDGDLRHPSDGDCWKEFDKLYEWFSIDCRNVRLGLATDGFNPFGNGVLPQIVENGVCQDSEPEDDYHEIQITEADEVSLYRSNVAAEVFFVTVDSSQDMELDTSKDYEELDEIEEEELVEISDEDNTNDPLQSDSDEDFF